MWHMRDGFNLQSNKEFIEIMNDGPGKVILTEIDEFYTLTDELGIDGEMLKIICQKYYPHVKTIKGEYKKKPVRVRQDNKRVKNYGNGSGYLRDIRYPSKKRSRATWRRFYTLFPYLAKRDNWDGKTSDKMK